MTLRVPVVRRPGLVVAGIASAALLAGVTSGDPTIRAVRAIAVVAFLGLLAVAVQRRGHAADRPSPDALAIRERAVLGRDTGIAVVSIGPRRLLVGYGPTGVTRLAELGIDGSGDAS